jgi:putative transposase
MKLASSSYYYKAKCDVAGQARSDAELRDHIERIQGEFSGYGYRRLGRQLRREGIRVNDKRIRRVQRKYQLFPIRWRTFKIATTDSNHSHKIYPNLLAQKTLTGINQAWVADITYIRILKGFVFLAALLDRYSRKLIGWAISQRIDAELCVAALRVALEQRQPPPGCVHHSDRGVQYACAEYITLLEQAQMQISMSRTANPYDNAHMESFFKTLKYEEVHLANYETYDDVVQRIPHFIEEVYNSKRLHSALGYLPPVEYEMAIQSTTKNAVRPSLKSR